MFTVHDIKPAYLHKSEVTTERSRRSMFTSLMGAEADQVSGCHWI